MIVHWEKLSGEFHHRIFFRLHAIVLIGKEHFQAGEQEESAEDIENPRILMHRRCANADHQAAHDECTNDAPEKNAMLILGFYLEESEDERNHEYVVHR